MDMKYVRDLASVDDRVMSVSPQTGKASRPFVGVIVINEDRKYCVPLSSPKPKHESMRNGRDFTKVYDPKGKLIAVLNFNNMIPVNREVVDEVDLVFRKQDDASMRAYKMLMRNQIDWCNTHADEIIRKANKLYRIITMDADKYRGLARRCCNFVRLEAVLDARA